jgi:GAF domain-containing protein
VGALQAARPAAQPAFNAEEIQLLAGMAIQVALVLRASLRLSTEQWRLKHRASQLSSLYEVGSAITSILDPEQLLGEVVELIQKRFGYPFVHLFSVHTGRRKVFYEAGSGPRSLQLREQNFASTWM